VPDFSDQAEVTRDAKFATRTTLLARRRRLGDAERATAARHVQADLADLVRRLRPRRMTAYVPVASEPGGPELPAVLHAALPEGAELLLPVLRADLDLDWAPWTGPDDLVAAGRGMREPTAPPLGQAAVTTADLVVLPVIFEGELLGVIEFASVTALSDLYLSFLERLALPVEPHDRPVHAVVTPTNGLRTLDGAAPR